jgi:hypothetical protein
MKYMIGSGFSTEIYEWVWFSKILNIWMGVFWKSQPCVCTQKYRKRPSGGKFYIESTDLQCSWAFKIQTDPGNKHFSNMPELTSSETDAWHGQQYSGFQWWRASTFNMVCKITFSCLLRNDLLKNMMSSCIHYSIH